ncbi:unnamed protein product [Rotaria socialis]|uniref:RRM domain-containing protein n=1 Tax=Rotaria socialis TaxID=392032 RepID=A0A820FKX2_9BILA|nr:unnamed protein product [Rotaria socialis]
MSNNNRKHKSESTSVYLGNTRTLSNEYINEYCSKFGLILDCSRRLLAPEQASLVDFTFVRFLNAQSTLKFLSTSSHTLNNGINLDVRPFDDILHTAVPLHVDRKICIKDLPSYISLSDAKKYLRTFGPIKSVNSDTNDNEENFLYVEFESAASRNKLLKGKIKHHRIRDHILNILPLLRPTDVDLHQMEEQKSTALDDPSTLIYLELEYNLKMREQFSFIDNEISELIKLTNNNNMYRSSTSTTIYVGNIQSITDDQLHEYFQRFGKIEACYHNCTRAADEWLIDYRFIRFSSDTNMNIILTNKIDHTIGRIRLDIHPYEAAFHDDTRLVLDRKICIAHTDINLNRNLIKKAFTRFGRILNCTCVSSGNGLEHVYIEYESINAIKPIVTSNQRHSVGRTTLAVKKALRPSEVGVKQELISHDENISREPTVPKHSYSGQRLNSNVETAQYSSLIVNHHNRAIENELRTSNLSSESQRRLSVSSSMQQSDENTSATINNNASQLCRTAVVERDQLKEQVVQFERDNCQLKFENETLRYRLRERSLSISMPSDNPITVPTESISVSSPNRQGRNRACSLSSIMNIAHENESITRSLSSLNCILNR